MVKMESEEKLRKLIGEILSGINSDFKYCGHGHHLGMWETSDENEFKWTDLEKLDGPDEIDRAMFRVTVYCPCRFGIQIKVEMFPYSIYDWETVYYGYIQCWKTELEHIFFDQLGMKRP